MSHCVIRNNTTDLIEKVITDSGENSILYNKIIDKLPDNIQYNQLSDYLKNQIGNGNIKDLSKEEIALGIWNKYSNQNVEGRDVDINDELDIKYIDIDSEVKPLELNKTIINVNPAVEENLKTFFTQFGFQFKEGDSSTDLLQKIIYTSKKDNNVFIDNSVKALSQLLLANTNIDFNKLQDLIEDTSEFKNLLKNSSEYVKNTHQYLKDGNRLPMEEWVSYIKEYNKIKNIVLEKYLKESLLDKNNSTKLHQLINDFLQFFKDLFTNSKNLKQVTDSLIQQVLNNQKEVVINSQDLKNKERVTLAKALEETTHGKDIIKVFGEFGLILTGSVSAAEQGSVFRKVGKLLHDIDWVVPKGFTKDFNKKLKDTFTGATLVREFDSTNYYTQTYIVPPKGYTISNLTFFKPEVYGERKYIASYDVLDKNGNVVSNYRRYYNVKESGKVVENREVYNEGLQNVDKNLEAVSVDFFQNKEELKFKPYTVNVEGIELQLSNWMSSFTEKLKYGRAKDLLDYANFIPNNLISSQIKPLELNEVNFQLKAVNLITNSINDIKLWSKQLGGINEKFWEKVQQKLQIPKEQIKLLKESIGNTIEEKLLNFIANYSYTVEINTAKEKVKTGTEEVNGSPIRYYSKSEDRYYRYTEELGWISSDENNKNQEVDVQAPKDLEPTEFDKYSIDTFSELETQHYSNLTVPGGTNYTENEIATPAITPSIKGHAQFATDKGIGWFRSDDRQVNLGGAELSEEYKPGIEQLPNGKWVVSYLPITGGRKLEFFKTEQEAKDFVKDITKTSDEKTRRILEVQSDYFQKLRKKFTFNNITYRLDDRSEQGTSYYKNGVDITKQEYNKAFEDFIYEGGDNQFLALLHKGDNWITFFVKSIIQDSAKKGYEKVVFPTGSTAYKIESGGNTIEDFIKNKETRLKQLKDAETTVIKKENKSDPYDKPFKIIRNNQVESTYTTRDAAEKESYNFNINISEEKRQIEKEIKDAKEGASGLAATAKFYETTIANVLKKQGYNPKLVTDEYGNTWNEVEITSEFKETIFLKPNTSNKTSNSNTNLVNQNILAEQSSETPFKNILQNILKTGKVGNMTDLDLFYAKLLLDNLNTFNPTLRIAKLEDALGSINVATQVITLDEDLIKSGNYEAVVQTVLHEVGHGFLLFPFSAVSGELNEADRMFKLTVNNLFANYKAKHKAANKRFGDDVKNGFKDVEEFLAEFISSKTFREYLYDLDRTLLQRIWDSIKTFFRYKVTRKESNDYKALDTIINSYILNGKTINTLKFKHQLKRTVYNKNKASTLQDVKANIIKEIDRLMIDLRDKSYGSSTLKKLNQLQDQLLDVSEETAIDLYLERVESIFSKTVAKFNAIEKDLHNIDDWDVEKFTDLFYTMNMYKSYLKNFNMWDAGDEQSITEFLRANDMPIDPRIDLLAGKKRSIDFLYSRIAVKLVSRSLASKELLEELNANITDVNKKITYEQLEQSLKYLTDVQDINAPSLQAEAAINSKDLITALVANKIKSALNDAIEEDINLESKLSLLYNKAFSRIESTVNSFKSLFGKYIHEVEYLEHTDYDDSKNKVYSKVKKKAFITEIDYSKYQANKNAFYASLEKLPELPKAGDEDYQILIRDYREIKARNNIKISLWSKQNEELHPDYQKIMDKKKEYLSPEEYNDWFKTNTDTLNGDFKVPESRKDKLIGQNENGDWIIAKKELVTPKKSIYTNPKWASVKDDKFYIALLDAYNEANMKLPKSKRLKYGVIPQRPKSWKEYTIEGKVPKNRLTGKGAKELDEKWGKNYTEVEEKEFWNAGLHTIDTKSYLPIYYTSSIDEDDVSMDILQSVLKFASSSNKFSAFYKINPEISLMKDVVFGTNVIDRMEGRYTIKTDNKGNPTGEKINVTTRANEQLMSFLENSFYNTKVESPKAARIASNVTGFTSFVQLGGNLISSIPNAIYANFVVAQEAIFSKHFGGKGDLVKAHTIVTGSLVHDLAKFSGAVEHVDSKTAYLAKLFQAVQGNHQNEFGENASNKIMNNLFSQNSFFILYSIPEYEIQTTTMVAMMLKTMVKTKSGESISLWDAYEQDETGRVALKPGVIFTKDQRNTLISKLHKANKELHGNYNKFDTPKLKTIWYGKFLFQFRNHIFEGFKRRFVKEYFDVEAREYKKGYYRSGIDAGLNALTHAYIGLVKLMELAGVQMDKDKYKFAKLSAPDKIDSYKMMVDVITVVGLYYILLGLQAMAKAGDDDDELIYYAITTAKKVQTDISFYWLIDFDAVIKQVRNPAVVMTFAENLLKGTELLVKAAYQDPNDPEQTSYYKIDTGRYKKGDLKAKKHLYKAIPLLNQYERDVKEVAEWYLHPN